MTINGIKPRSLNRHRDIPIKEIKLCPPYWLVPTKIFNIPAPLLRNVRRETAKAVQHEWWFWVSLSIKSHPSTKEREEKSLYFDSNRIGNPSIIYFAACMICCYWSANSWEATASLLPTPQRNSFIPALLMTFVKKSMNLIRFPQISSSTFILFTNSNHGMAIIFIFLICVFFLQNCLSLVQYGIELPSLLCLV